MKEDNIGRKNLKPKTLGSAEELDENLREYNRMLHAHHRYTQKIRGLSSLGINTMDEKKQDQIHDADKKRNLLHLELKKLAEKVGKSSSDVMVDLLLLDGGMEEYGLDLPIVSLDNSPDIVKKQKYRRESRMKAEYLWPDLQDYQPIKHNEVALIIGTETADQFDAEGKTVSTYRINTEDQMPVVDAYTFSSGFTERMMGIKQLVADYPELVQFFATGAFHFHGSTRSYGILINKSELIKIAGILRHSADKYLPSTKSKSIQVNIPIEYGVASEPIINPKFSEIMSLIPDEMLCDDDLTRKLGEDKANEYLKKRWGK